MEMPRHRSWRLRRPTGAVLPDLPLGARTDDARDACRRPDLDWTLYGNLNFVAVKKYIAYRAERGWKPLKQSRLNVLAKRLIDYPLQVQMAMVDQTIGNRWQGGFAGEKPTRGVG